MSKLDAINKKYDELQELVLNFTKEYGIRQAPYFAPIYELMNMLGFQIKAAFYAVVKNMT